MKDLCEVLRKAGLIGEHEAMIVDNPLIASAVVAEVTRICTTVTDVLHIPGERNILTRVYTGAISVPAIEAGIKRLAEQKGVRLTKSALAKELGTSRQNLYRAFREDSILLSVYATAIEKAQRMRATLR